VREEPCYELEIALLMSVGFNLNIPYCVSTAPFILRDQQSTFFSI